MAGAAITMGSERSFGLVFAGVFAVVGLWPVLGGDVPRTWAMAPATLLLLVALARPAVLAPFNRLWFRFGLALGKVMTPVVMALLFALALVPTGLVLRLLGKDPLRLRLDRDAPTYWQRREAQPGPMREQF